jgi:putative ABC transport system substrate-binding protein
VPIVGLLWNDSIKPSPYVFILTEALRVKGYVVGRNLRFDDAVALEGYSPMAENAKRLVQTKADVIVTIGATATLAAAKATREIPVVMVMGADPVALGLAKSVARPGANVTGVWAIQTGLNAKRVELLKQLMPRLSRVGVLYAPSGAVQLSFDEIEATARTLKIETVKAEARKPDDIEPAIATLAKSRPGAIFVLGSTALAARSERVVAAMAKHRMAAVYSNERYVEAGGLMIYSASTRKALQGASRYVDRILNGARPEEMPIEQSTDVDLVINLKTARALGITIPQSILQRADRAID